MRLTGNTILITGGGSGIGRGLAHALAARGNTVIVAGRRVGALEDAAGSHPRIETLALDVTDPRSITEAAGALLKRHPGLNVVVNNAGIMTDEDPAAAIDDEALVQIVSTNLLGPVRVISAFIEHLRTTPESAIINVTSMLGYVPLARSPLYSATKAAMHSYTLSLRHRLGRMPPEIIEIAPPLTRTGLQPVNLVHPNAMPLDEFIVETVAALESGHPEAYVERARERRDAQRVDDIRITRTFNNMMGSLEVSPSVEE